MARARQSGGQVSGVNPQTATAWPLRHPLFSLSLAVAAASLAVYAQAIGFEWLSYDDKLNVTEQFFVKDGFSALGILVAVTRGMNEFWFPVTSFSHMLDVELFGLNPAGHHATNVLLHTVNAVMVVLVFRKLTRSLWAAALAGFLFAVHPLHAEPVGWVSGRRDLLCAFFWLATILAYLRYAERLNWRAYLPVPLLFLLGMASKTNMIALLPLLFVLDWQPLQRIWEWRRLPRCLFLLTLEKLPMAAAAALGAVLTYRLQAAAQNLADLAIVPLSVRLANSIYVYGFYLAKAIYPIGLSVHYPYYDQGPPVLDLAAACVALIVISIAALVFARRLPLLLVGWLWFLLGLAPTLSLFRVANFLTADRYVYIPMLGIYLMLGTLLAAALTRWPGALRPAAAVLAVLLAVLSVLGFMQARYWRNELALWEHGIQYYPDGAMMLNGYGMALDAAGRTAEAIPVLEKLRAKDSKYSLMAKMNLSVIAGDERRWSDALRYISELLRQNPTYEPAYTQLIKVLGGAMEDSIDETRRKQLDAEIKIANFQKLIVSNMAPPTRDGMEPNLELAAAYSRIAEDLLNLKRADLAFELAKKAGLADPANPRYPNVAGRAVAAMGKYEDAAAFFKVAIRLDGTYAPALAQLAEIDEKRNSHEGRDAFEKALLEHPTDAELLTAYAKTFGRAPTASPGGELAP